MREQSGDRAGAGLKIRFRRAASGLARIWVRRDEDLFGQVTWELRDGPLVIAMVTAALAGFGAASAMSGAMQPWGRPVLAHAAADDEASVQPQHMLKIQVRSDLPARSEPAPSPMAAPVPVVQIPVEPLPAPLARPAPTPVAAAPRPAMVAALAPAPGPVRMAAARAPAPVVAVPIALPRAQPEPRRADEDMELALADRELAKAYRDADRAGVSAAELRADQQAWRTARAGTAGRSRDDLLNAYRDHIDDLRDAAEDAQAGRQPRYAESPAYYPQGYGPPRY